MFYDLPFFQDNQYLHYLFKLLEYFYHSEQFINKLNDFNPENLLYYFASFDVSYLIAFIALLFLMASDSVIKRNDNKTTEDEKIEKQLQLVEHEQPHHAAIR